MTVKELIEILQEYCDDNIVVLDKGRDWMEYEIDIRFTTESTEDWLQDTIVIY